jgi:hypothetical protein
MQTVDHRFDLGPREADVPQGAVVELVQPCNRGATGKIARDPLPTSADKLSEYAGTLRDIGPNDRCKGC